MAVRAVIVRFRLRALPEYLKQVNSQEDASRERSVSENEFHERSLEQISKRAPEGKPP
jgi:hypothetical protein